MLRAHSLQVKAEVKAEKIKEIFGFRFRISGVNDLNLKLLGVSVKSMLSIKTTRN